MIDPERIREIFFNCYFNENNDTGESVKVDSIGGPVGFHPSRLENHKAEIETMLDELPYEFKESGGGGMSFLQAHVDKHGKQWTGFHELVEKLFLLGFGIGKVKYFVSRKLWASLPGGMPYYVITD